MKLINIGFGSMVSDTHVVSVISPDSAPIKRMIQDAREAARLVDATYGRKCKSVILTDSNHLILSSLSPETVSGRLAEEASNE